METTGWPDVQTLADTHWVWNWMSPRVDSYQRQILWEFKTEQILICPYIVRCDDLPQLSGSLPSSLRETGLARVHLGLSVPPGESVFSVCFFCYSAGTGSAFQGWKCQRNKEAPLKRSFPPQKGNISAYPLNNNIQRDSLASDPKKEKRPRTLGNIYTHPFAGETAGLGLCHPKHWIKGTETSTLQNLLDGKRG